MRSTDRILQTMDRLQREYRFQVRMQGQDSQCQMSGMLGIADMLKDQIGDLRRAHVLHFISWNYADAEGFRRFGADADLDRPLGVDDAFARRAGDKRPWSIRLPSSNQVS